MNNSTHGSIFVISAPSGAGKSSIVDAVLASESDVVLSVSCTTREPRPGEIDGRHYRFISIDEFEKLRDTNNLLEWAKVHDNYYGTPRDTIDTALEEGKDVLLEIDWQGALQVKQYFPDAIGIFILPPSIHELETRLTKRGQDSIDVINRRLAAASEEISKASSFEYVIINQEFSLAVKQVISIISSARLRYKKQAARCYSLFNSLGVK